MGGDYEKKVEAEPVKQKPTPTDAEKPSPTATLRIHQNKGEIHFHDDKQKIKLAMPVAEYQVLMRQVKRLKPFHFIDEVNKTVLIIDPFFDGGVAAVHARPAVQPEC